LAPSYDPTVFDAADMNAARRIILTPEGGLSTDQRWEVETPYLGAIVGRELALEPARVVLDYGCGVGRMAKELIGRYGCRIVGVDISPKMRAMAPDYVGSPRFATVSPEMLDGLVERGLRFDGALSVWVLQHCVNPADDIARIARALAPGGRLVVVNAAYRVVPTTERRWATDGVDMKALLADRLAPVAEGEFDPRFVSVRNTYWATYRAADAGAPA